MPPILCDFIQWTNQANGSRIGGVIDVQEMITELRGKGWTVAALADELGVDYDTVGRWQRGTRSPANAVGVRVVLGQLLKRQRIPKRRRYTRKPPATNDRGL